MLGLIEFRGELIAYGNVEQIGGVLGQVAAWNGSEWHSLGAGPPGCLTIPLRAAGGERLIMPVGTSCGFSAEGTLQTWNGDTWETLPGLRGSISALADIDGIVYVSGDFTLDGGVEANIAAWDGQHWSTLGSGLNGSASAIVDHGGAIYFGGPFSVAGGKASFGIARWNGAIPPAPPRHPALSQARPNPFRTSADFSLRLDRGGAVRVGVYDVNGREVAVLVDGQLTVGLHPIHWDGRDRSGRSVPSGVYFVSVQGADGNVTSRKIVRTR